VLSGFGTILSTWYCSTTKLLPYLKFDVILDFDIEITQTIFKFVLKADYNIFAVLQICTVSILLYTGHVILAIENLHFRIHSLCSNWKIGWYQKMDTLV